MSVSAADRIEIRPVAAGFGAEICGVNLADDVTDKTIAAIRDTLARFGVIFFHKQSLSPQQHLAAMVESITKEFHGGRETWVGQLCYNDNHISVSTTFWPEGLNFTNSSGQIGADDIFSADEDSSPSVADGADVYLAMISQISGNVFDESSLEIRHSWD